LKGATLYSLDRILHRAVTIELFPTWEAVPRIKMLFFSIFYYTFCSKTDF